MHDLAWPVVGLFATWLAFRFGNEWLALQKTVAEVEGLSRRVEQLASTLTLVDSRFQGVEDRLTRLDNRTGGAAMDALQRNGRK